MLELVEHGQDDLFLQIEHIHHFFGVQADVQRLVCAVLFQLSKINPLLLALARIVLLEVPLELELLNDGRLLVDNWLSLIVFKLSALAFLFLLL